MYLSRIPFPRGRTGHVAQGDSARDERNWRAAAEAYRKALAVDSTNAPIWVQLGHALKESGNLTDAELAYRRALQIDSSTADTHLQLGHALKLQGKFREAINAYSTALCLCPTLPHPSHELQLLGFSTRDLANIAARHKKSNTGDQCSGLRLRHAAWPTEAASQQFGPDRYMEVFRDVAHLVQMGLLSSPEQHYLHYGYRQGRDIVMSLAKVPPSRVVVLCPSFFKKCGIGEHAKYLANSFELAGLETIRIRSTRELGGLSTEKLQDAMLVVNHGPGLFDGYNPELSEGETTTDLLTTLISAYAKYNLRSVIYMHSMLDRDNADMFPRQQYALQFPIPVVTTIESAARHFNIPRLEHGMQPIAIPSAPTPPNALQARPRDNPVIGFFGFFQYGGKNFDALLNLAQALKAKIVGSVATRDTEQVQALRKMLEERSITCELGTGWIDDEALASRLAEADFYYLPQYDYDHWNNSGTARFAMNFGKPVLVPPHSPFLDLRDYAIFAEESDLSAILSWLRDASTYNAASLRTARYAKAHSMLTSIPRLATSLPAIVSDCGLANFVSLSTFSAFSLLGLDPAHFNARIAYALGGNADEDTNSTLSGDAHSPERATFLGRVRRRAPNKLQANFPVVMETQYWREHYEIEEFLFGTTAELLFATHRAILKRDPQLVDFDIGSSAALKKPPTGREILELLGRLIRGHHELEFAPPVLLYHRGGLINLEELTSPALASELDSTIERRLHSVATLGVQEETEQLRSSMSDRNLFHLLMLDADSLHTALTGVFECGSGSVSVESIGNSRSVMDRYLSITNALVATGMRPTELFLLDRPIASPVDDSRTVYRVPEFWPLEGDEFITNLVRGIMKREPLTHEMFMLDTVLKENGKFAAIAMVAAHPWANARIADLGTCDPPSELNARFAELRALEHAFRSPIAGGWQLRNDYLEAKRNYARFWTRSKKQKDIWWTQAGERIEPIRKILGV